MKYFSQFYHISETKSLPLLALGEVLVISIYLRYTFKAVLYAGSNKPV